MVEVDGCSHMQNAIVKKDRLKEVYLNKHKITVLRVRNIEVMKDMGNVLRKIGNAARSAILLNSTHPSFPSREGK